MIFYITIFVLGVIFTTILYKTKNKPEPPNQATQEGFTKIFRAFSKFGKMISRFFGRFKYIKRGFVALGPAFGTMFKNIGVMAGGVFINTFQYLETLGEYTVDWIRCTSEKLKNIYYCIFFYILDTFIYFNLVLLQSTCVLLDEIFRIKRLFGTSLEDLFEQSIKQLKDVDGMLYSYVGIHFLQYPDIILDMCYRCKKQPNKEKLRKRKEKFNYDFYVKFPKKADEISRRFKAVGDNFKKFF